MTDSSVDAYIAQIAKQVATQTPTADVYANYINSNPDLLAAFNSLKAQGAVGAGKQFADISDFGQYHYNNNGKAEGRALPYPTATYIASDGKTFTDPNQYRDYQTGLDTNTYGTRSALALSNAKNNVNQRFAEAGLDPTAYSSQIDQYLNQLGSANGGDVSSDPTGEYGTNPGGDIIDSLTAQQRSQNTRAVSSVFTPTYDQTALDKTPLTTALNQILGQQQTSAQGTLDRALKRGQINDTGYTAGEQDLGTQQSGATSKLNSLENDVLSNYSDKLDTIANSARTAASGSNLGDNFDIGDYTSQANNVIGNYTANAGGDLVNAVGNQNLFDLSDLLTKAGTAQGPQNLGDLDVLDSVDKIRKAAAVGRGLGSQGAF